MPTSQPADDRQSPTAHARPRLLIPYLVLAVSLLLTAGVAAYVASVTEARERARFDSAVERTQMAISQRIETYVNLLLGGAGLFASDTTITGKEFRKYVDRLRLRERYPGIQGIGVSARVLGWKKRDLEERVRREGNADFAIRPPEPRDEYHAIIYIEPLDKRNRAAIGYDMFTEPTRRAAMELARDTGRPATTGRVTLVQEIDADRRQAGFLIYVPVYHLGLNPEAPAARRLALAGFVYAPFRANDFLGGIFAGDRHPEGIEFAVYDGNADPATAEPLAAFADSEAPRTQSPPGVSPATVPATVAPAGIAPAAINPAAITPVATTRDAAANAAPATIAPAGIAPTTASAAAPPPARAATEPADPPRFTRSRRLDVPGRQWTVVYRSGKGFERAGITGFTLLALLIGGAVSVLLFALTAAQAAAQQRAERAADGLRRAGDALRASESRFRRLADSNLVGVVFSTVDGRILDGNDEYFRIVGRTRDDVARGTVRWDAMTPPEYAEVDRRAVEELTARGSCTPFEKEFLRPDGSRVPALVGVAMLEGSTTETVALYVDLTKQKQAEAEIVRAKETAEALRADAEEASRLKDEFLATVSHELRTPLNAILGWAQLLRGGRSNPDDAKHGLETIERSAKAQAQLIDDLLDVSRIIAGKLRLDVKIVRPLEVIEAALASVRPAAEAKNVKVVQVLDPAAGPVHGDPGRLQQIVWNLLSNAVKFTPRGGAVQVVLKRDASNAVISVSDTGVGISSDFLPHVFERFRQADASTTRRFGGLGLGLGIVRHLTELHGGTVHAESPGEGKGATFTVMLPLAIAHAHGGGPQGGAIGDEDLVGAGGGSPQLVGVRVLLVEDDTDARDLIARALRDRGASVTAASSAAEAVDAFDLLCPHVLVSDIGMPDEDGYALIARIRARAAERGGRVPAVALTALARPEDRRRALLAGFQVHVAKPVEPAELAAVVANLATTEASVD